MTTEHKPHSDPRATVERERQIRHWTIPQLRDEFGSDWPAAHANAIRAADEAVDGLFEQFESLRDAAAKTLHEYDLWAEDANDGEFAIWSRDEFMASFVGLRNALIWAGTASSPASEPEIEWIPATVVNEYGEKVGPQGMWRPSEVSNQDRDRDAPDPARERE